MDLEALAKHGSWIRDKVEDIRSELFVLAKDDKELLTLMMAMGSGIMIHACENDKIPLEEKMRLLEFSFSVTKFKVLAEGKMRTKDELKEHEKELRDGN